MQPSTSSLNAASGSLAFYAGDNAQSNPSTETSPQNRSAAPPIDGLGNQVRRCAVFESVLFDLHTPEFDAWLAEVRAADANPPTSAPVGPIATTPDACASLHPASRAPSRPTCSPGPDSFPFAFPTFPFTLAGAVSHCVSPSPADTVFSPVPPLSYCQTADSPDVPGPPSPYTPSFAPAVMPVTVRTGQSPSAGSQPSMSLSASRATPEGYKIPPTCEPTLPARISYGSLASTVHQAWPAMLEVPQVDAPGIPGPWRTVPRSAKQRRFNAAPKANKRYHCPWCEGTLRYMMVQMRSLGSLVTEAMDRKSNLDVHIWEKHDPNFVPSQCPHCPKSYTRSNALKAHIRQKHADVNAPHGPGTGMFLFHPPFAL